MLNRLLTKNVFLTKIVKDLYKNESGNSSTPNTMFPYRIGGFKSHLPNEQSIQTFARDKKEQILGTYKKLLDAIESRDKIWLESKAQTQLIDPLLSRQDLIQVNRQSTVELLFHRMSIGMRVPFKRMDIPYQLLVDKNNVAIYTPKEQDPSEMTKFLASGIPVLLSFHMAVRSSRKLVPKNNQSKEQQFHLLTMEQQTNVQLVKMIKVMNKIHEEGIQNFHKLLLGSNEPWNIGNIDDFLKQRY